MTSEKTGYPVLKGMVVGDQVVVWCPFCNKFHYHGAATFGHRAAHCHTAANSSLKATGYYIEPFTNKELKQMGLKTLKSGGS